LSVFRPFRPQSCGLLLTRGDALRACPWLSYPAPLALRIICLRLWRRASRLPWLSYPAPLALRIICLRLWRRASRLPLAFISRAFGAANHMFVTLATRFALAPGFHILRLWRCESYVCDLATRFALAPGFHIPRLWRCESYVCDFSGK